MAIKRPKPEEIVVKLRQVEALKRLQKENERLRRAVYDLTLDKLILKEAASGNFWAPYVSGPTLTLCVVSSRLLNDKRVERLWLNDGSCVRLRPEYRNHVWSYDFMHHRTNDGRAFRILNILDEHSRECLAIRVKRKLNSTEVIDALTGLFILRGVPAYIRSDNGPEFIAEAVRGWVKAVGAKTAYIEPGSLWLN
jgi:transposase InsO family protein